MPRPRHDWLVSWFLFAGIADWSGWLSYRINWGKSSPRLSHRVARWSSKGFLHYRINPLPTIDFSFSTPSSHSFVPVNVKGRFWWRDSLRHACLFYESDLLVPEWHVRGMSVAFPPSLPIIFGCRTLRIYPRGSNNLENAYQHQSGGIFLFGQNHCTVQWGYLEAVEEVQIALFILR